MIRKNNGNREGKDMEGWDILYDESDVCLLACADMVNEAYEARDMMKWYGANCSLIDCRSGRFLDETLLRTAAMEHVLLVTVQEHEESGGFGELVQSFLDTEGLNVEVEQIALPEEYAQSAPGSYSREEAGLDAGNIYRRIQTRMIGLIK